MEVLNTPKTENTTRKRKSSDDKQSETPVRIPETPFMTRLGCGTGVSVYSMARTNSGTPTHRSPWAVKKVNRSNKGVTAEFEMRINNEAEILKTISHPNVVGFRALAETGDGRKCLAMEECQESLADIIQEREEENSGPFPVCDIVKVGLDVAQALSYLHGTRHILHGDLKSANVLIKDDFLTAKLCDFGVSLPLDANGKYDDTNIDLSDQGYIGTACWSAPEVLESADGPITNKADIFSFGLVLWEMLALQAPHITVEGEDPDASFDEESFNKRIGTRPPLPQLPNEYQPIIDIFNACTEHDLELRPDAESIIKMFQLIT